MQDKTAVFDLKDDCSSYPDARHKVVLSADYFGSKIEAYDSRTYDGWIVKNDGVLLSGPADTAADAIDDMCEDNDIYWDMTDKAANAVSDIDPEYDSTEAEDLAYEADANTSWYKQEIENSTDLTGHSTMYRRANESSHPWYEYDDIAGSIEIEQTGQAPEAAPMVSIDDDGNLDSIIVYSQYLDSLDELDDVIDVLTEARRQIAAILEE